MICSETHAVDNGDGWKLALYQTWHSERLDRQRRPVLIVPGYGMNSYIFDFHPTGKSFVRSLVEAGFEVWRVDLRAQGGSTSDAPNHQYSLADLALTDLGAAIAAVSAKTQSNEKQVDTIGASLGGSLLLAHAVLAKDPKLGALVVMGSPVRWVDVHPLLQVAFASPMLVGLLRFRGTRKIAELALPPIAKFLPGMLRIYMNPDITDTKAARDLVKTVEDPNRFINVEIAHWVNRRDLIVNGVNISESLGKIRAPLMCVLANIDGIVPRPTAEFAYHATGSAERKLHVVGSEQLSVAHADMFISNAAEAHVFAPIAEWLKRQNSAKVQVRDAR